MQLVELQKVLGELSRDGVGLIGVSYDPPEVLREFADAKGIGFPLLSDQGSRVITELGLLDRDLDVHHDAFGVPTQDHQWGVAYPVVFVLDEAGRVVHKRIQENYRAREGALKLLAEGLGIGPANQGEFRIASGPRLRARVVADSDEYVRWQKTRLHMEFDIDPDWHAYGRPIPEGYTPLQVELNPLPGLQVGEPDYPPTDPFRVEGLDEEFVVYQGQVNVSIPFAVNVPPGTGEITLLVRVRYQLCSDQECLPPSSLSIEILLREAPAV